MSSAIAVVSFSCRNRFLCTVMANKHQYCKLVSKFCRHHSDKRHWQSFGSVWLDNWSPISIPENAVTCYSLTARKLDSHQHFARSRSLMVVVLSFRSALRCVHSFTHCRFLDQRHEASA